jgi:hypothetical protein
MSDQTGVIDGEEPEDDDVDNSQIVGEIVIDDKSKITPTTSTQNSVPLVTKKVKQITPFREKLCFSYIFLFLLIL